MLGPRGKTWLIMVLGLLCSMLAPLPGAAADPSGGPRGGWSLVGLTGAPSEAASSLEAQLLADRPFHSKSFPLWVNPLNLGKDGLKLPGNLELRISFLYHHDSAAPVADRAVTSHPLFKYSMDYGLLPNLQVGFTGFFYHPHYDPLTLERRSGRMVLGLGPGFKYDLGRWSFTFSSSLSPKNPEGDRDLQNWFRVWYAF